MINDNPKLNKHRNSKVNLEIFICDVLNVLEERKQESDEIIQNNKNDLFESGRNLAYSEVLEIIENRLNIYDIKLE